MQHTSNGIHVTMPNLQTIQATHTCQLDLPGLPPGARLAHKFPHLAYPLISIGQLCDNGCNATFDAKMVHIYHDNLIILSGNRDPHTRLWTLPLTKAQPPAPDVLLSDAHQAHSAYHNTSQIDHIAFLHAACGYPVPSTWIKAIDHGHFATWPGLTADLVRKHLPKSPITVLGHLHQQRQNIRSTQPPPEPELDSNPPSDPGNSRTHLVFSAVADLRTEIATDLTGLFPITSSMGNKYILVCYVYDCNAILTAPMKSRSEVDHIRAFDTIRQYLVDRGFTPTHQRLDNEASSAFKSNLRQHGIDFQLVPPPQPSP